MTINKAIEMADKLRPNAVDESIKARWVEELNAKLSEMMGLGKVEELPPPNDDVIAEEGATGSDSQQGGGTDTEIVYPARDQEEYLLMPWPYDNIYTLYLCAMIDFAQEETALYADDMTVFNQAMSEAKAWWRRNNKNPHRHHHYKGVWRH